MGVSSTDGAVGISAFCTPNWARQLCRHAVLREAQALCAEFPEDDASGSVPGRVFFLGYPLYLGLKGDQKEAIILGSKSLF